MHFEPLSSWRCQLGESPLWHEAALWSIDIVKRELLCWITPQTPARWSLPSEPGCIAPRAGGGLVVARRDGLWSHAATPELLLPPPHDPARVRLNDGKADRQGRFWVGGISDADAAEAEWYCVQAPQVRRHWPGTRCANGLAWSPDGRWMYRADSPLRCVWRHAYDPATGEPGPGEVWLQFKPEEGYPDGAAVDVDGCYWLAMWDGGALLQFAPDGRRLRRIELPVRRPTMPCFGGADGRSLYLTSAALGQPPGLDGAVLLARAEVAGLPPQAASL